MKKNQLLIDIQKASLYNVYLYDTQYFQEYKEIIFYKIQYIFIIKDLKIFRNYSVHIPVVRFFIFSGDSILIKKYWMI